MHVGCCKQLAQSASIRGAWSPSAGAFRLAVLVPICIGSVYAWSTFNRPRRGQWLPFQASLFVIFTMYGGGFATIPAFLADIFGPQNVGAIHGALLTAWSAAAIAGPVIITELSNRAKAALPPGANRVNIYDTPLQVLAALLAVGFVVTLLVRPLARQQYEPQPVRVRTGPKSRSGSVAVVEPED